MMRFSDKAMTEYRRLVNSLASAQGEARGLAVFLRGLLPLTKSKELPLSLVHGQCTRIEAHRMIRAVDGLSVASPYCSATLDFDVMFRGALTGLEMLFQGLLRDVWFLTCSGRPSGLENSFRWPIILTPRRYGDRPTIGRWRLYPSSSLPMRKRCNIFSAG